MGRKNARLHKVKKVKNFQRVTLPLLPFWQPSYSTKHYRVRVFAQNVKCRDKSEPNWRRRYRRQKQYDG